MAGAVVGYWSRTVHPLCLLSQIWAHGLVSFQGTLHASSLSLLCCSEWVAICAGGAQVASAKSVGVPGYQTVLCCKTNRSREDGVYILSSHITTSCLKSLKFSGMDSQSAPPRMYLCQPIIYPVSQRRWKSESQLSFFFLLSVSHVSSVMPSSHLILCHPLLLLPPIPPSIRVFSSNNIWVSAMC